MDALDGYIVGVLTGAVFSGLLWLAWFWIEDIPGKVKSGVNVFARGFDAGWSACWKHCHKEMTLENEMACLDAQWDYLDREEETP